MGIEPTQPAWKAGILTIELHPQGDINYKYINRFCQVLFKTTMSKG